MVSKKGQPTSEDLRRNSAGEDSLSRESLARGSVKCAVAHGSNGWCPVRSKQEGKPTAHWWVMDSPDGPVSQGVCRGCGEKKDFVTAAHWRFNGTSRKKGEY